MMDGASLRTQTDAVYKPDGTAVQIELVMMGPQEASRYLDEFNYDKQRPSSQGHIDFLTYEMKANRFATEAMYVVHYDGKGYLTDGRHRLRAIMQYGKPELVPVVHIHAKDKDAIADDYIRRDCGRVRTVAHAYTATDLATQTELTNTQLNALGAACHIITGGFQLEPRGNRDPALRSRDIRKKSVLYWARDAKAFFTATAGSDADMRKALNRAAVLAVALVTIRYQPEKAAQFWHRVALNDGLRRREPEHTLVQYLQKYEANSMRRNKYARGVANGWNAHLEESPLCIIKVPDAMLDKPIQIMGSPYNGKNVLTVNYD